MRTFICLFLAGWLLSGCANKVAPTGGAKDILPPVVISVEPPQKTIYFSSREINITFNEYVQLKDIGKQLVISPIITPPPRIFILKKSIVIELPDSLNPNTTYTINFGNAVADNNEGNILPQFQYIFSTGSYIDSLRITGKILNAETQKPEKGALAMLYKASLPDSLILKTLPDYFSRAADNGNFTIENIRDGRYRIFALVDKNNNYLLDPKDENAGFESMPFDLKDSVNFEIKVSKQPVEKQLVKPVAIDEEGKLVTTFSIPVNNPQWKFIGTEPTKVILEKSTGSDTLTLYCLPAKSDSVQVIWYDGETLLDTVLYRYAKAVVIAAPILKKGSANWKSFPSQAGILNGDSHPLVKWSAPVETFDTSRVQVWKDSVNVPVKISFLDSVKTQMQFEGLWKEGVYTLKLLPAAVYDFFGRTNDSVIVTFSVAGERTIGSISYKINSLIKANYILQLVNDRDEVVRQRFTFGVSDGTFERVEPGIYRLRLITDNNNNQRWDSGNIRKGIQPEDIDYHSESLTVRANWEVETIWNR